MSLNRYKIVKSETTDAEVPSVFHLFDVDPDLAVEAVTAFVRACADASEEKRKQGFPPVKLERQRPLMALAEALKDGELRFEPVPGLGDPDEDPAFERVRAEALRYLGVKPVVNDDGDVEIRRVND